MRILLDGNWLHSFRSKNLCRFHERPTSFLHKYLWKWKVPLKIYLWKLKVPLKIKIFMWYVKRKVILTKNNLIKRNPNGCKKCIFCYYDEIVEHVFVSCSFVRKIWRLIYFTFNISPPTSMANMFGSWLLGVDKKSKTCIRIGICSFIWAV